MPLPRFLPLALLALSACASPRTGFPPPVDSPPPLAEPVRAEEDSYGLVPENPVRVGGGPAGEREYLGALRSPRGEPVVSRRLGSCCEFETPNGFNGMGLLDIYEVTYDGLDAPVRLYLDMYDEAAVRAPSGFLLEGDAPSEGLEGTQEVIEL
jgi:hypothetical protein